MNNKKRICPNCGQPELAVIKEYQAPVEIAAVFYDVDGEPYTADKTVMAWFIQSECENCGYKDQDGEV